MSTWTCENCNVTIKASSVYAHKKSQKHKKNVINYECTICCNTTNTTCNCRSCHQKWCSKCDRNIATCPYCRADIPGRQAQADAQARENVNWYSSSDAFRPQSRMNRLEILGQVLTLNPSQFRAVHHDTVELFRRLGLRLVSDVIEIE